MNGDEIRDRVVYSVAALTAALVLIRITGLVDWPWYITFGPALALIGLAFFGSGLAILWVIAARLLRGRQ